MFRMALDKFKRRREEAIMVGDQMMTDILGANRAGIDAIWVRKMEGREFGGTRINRFVEGLLTGPIYKSLVTPVDEEADAPEVEAQKPLADRAIVHRFVKFAVVGGSSFVIDYCVRMTLLFALPFGVALGTWLQTNVPALFGSAQTPRDAAFPVCAAIAAGVAIVNSFIWNRMWTFGIRGREERAAQLQRFIVVSLVGAALNVFFSTVLNHVIPGDEKMSARVATIVAAILVAIWNFAGQSLYAFRKRTA
jgi:putative flippase GtrA